jgi:DNA-binding transcriptional LysR family regulator
MVANSIVVRELVSDGRADFGIAAVDRLATGVGSLSETPFCDDEVILAVPHGHAWAERESVALADFVAEPLVMRDPSANTRRVVDEALAALGLVLAPPLAEVGSTSAAKATAVSEGVPVLLSSLALGPADSAFVVRRIDGLSLMRRFVMLVAAEGTLRPAARALAAALGASPITAG